jgi:hypothetical protein
VHVRVDALVNDFTVTLGPTSPSPRVRSTSGLPLSRMDRVIRSSMFPAQAVWSLSDATNVVLNPGVSLGHHY